MERMERITLSLLFALGVATIQLPLVSRTMAGPIPGNLDASSPPISLVASKTNSSKARRSKQKRSYSYSSRPRRTPTSNPPSSSESGFGGRKFWKEQEDN